MRNTLIAAVAVILLTAVLWNRPAAEAQQVPAAVAVPAGFKEGEIRFDESDGKKLATPVLPKTWKLISVSNGAKANSNTLWFQDVNGDVICMQGFTNYNGFIISQSYQRLRAGK